MGILMEASDANLGTGVYRKPEIFTMSAPAEYYGEGMHTIAINTMETAFEGMEPIALKAYTPYINGHAMNYYPSTFSPRGTVALEIMRPTTSSYAPTPVSAIAEPKEVVKVQPPPKKKWIRDFYSEEPNSPLPCAAAVQAAAACTNGSVQRPASPPPRACSPRLNGHGTPQIPSPPSVGSNGSNGSGSGGSGSNGGTPRAGTREVHNKLEKNRRAHLKECFELLKRQLPATPDDKKTSNLSILASAIRYIQFGGEEPEKNRRAHLKECFELLKRQLPATPDDKKTSNLSILASAIRYIQVLRRKERECEHEMERLAREKIAAQQRLATLKREVALLATARPRSIETVAEDKMRDERVNGQVLGIPISITSSPPLAPRMEPSPTRSLNLTTKLRTLPIQITPTTSQVVRTSYGGRHNTLTLTTLAPADHIPTTQNGHLDNGMSSTTLSTTLVHPAQIHLPLSQVVSSGGLVVGGALQLLSTPGALRVLHAPQINGVTTSENNRLPRENGITTSPPASDGTGVVVSGLSQHVLHPHTLTHKMVETQMVKGSVAPLTVSAQYLSATALVKPVVVVSGSGTPPSTSA